MNVVYTMRIIALSILPFLCCIVGYIGMARMISSPDFVVPDLIGHSLPAGLSKLSEMHLCGYIVGEVEDEDSAVGTILKQAPKAGNKIKKVQSVGLFIVKKPKQPQAFFCIGKNPSEIAREAESLGVRLKSHEIYLEGSLGSCYGQYPSAGTDLSADLGNVMHIYVIKPPETVVLVPDIRGYAYEVASRQMASLGVELRCFQAQAGECDGLEGVFGSIMSQKPAPGEVIERNKLKAIYVQLSHVDP